MNRKSDYKVIGRIGEGAHGVVLKAKNRKTGEIVALKRMFNCKKDEKITISLLREIKSLQQINSPYVSIIYFVYKCIQFSQNINFLLHYILKSKCLVLVFNSFVNFCR